MMSLLTDVFYATIGFGTIGAIGYGVYTGVKGYAGHRRHIAREKVRMSSGGDSSDETGEVTEIAGDICYDHDAFARGWLFVGALFLVLIPPVGAFILGLVLFGSLTTRGDRR